MKRKFINALLVCGLIVTTAFSLSSCKDYDDDIDSLQEQINSLSSLTDSEVSTVESSIASLQTTASNLSSEISSVESSLEAAIAEKADADDVDALEIELASLEASLSSVESAIAALEAALEDYAKTSDVLEQIAILESGIAEAKAEAEAAQSAADAAQSAADAANSTLTTVISELATVYSDLQDQLTLLEESILSTVAETYATQASLESEITTVTSLIETLQNRIAELENSTETADALEEAKQELEAEIDSLKARVETLEGYKETLDNLDTTVANAVAEAENYADEAVADLKDYTDSEIGNIYDYINNNFTTTDGLAEINEAIADYYETKAELLESNEEILASLNTINEQIDAINTSIGKMYGILGKQLKSLVFNPELYWGGIEAIEVAYYSYDALGVDAVDADGDYSSDAPYSTGTSISVAPLVYASYYANPSNADIDTDDLTKWSFIGNTATYVSRAVTTADGDIDIKDVENTNGVIDVTFKVQASGLEELLDNDDDEVDVVALQYLQASAEEDTIITSDFAALYIDEISEFYINAVTTAGAVDTETPTTADQHLATTAADAISNYESGTAPILYVNFEGFINLDEWINVHKGNDELWGGQTTLAESCFYMTYELVGWVHGDNNTSESVHSTLSDADGDGTITETLTPTAYNGADIVTTVGRAPMVRVILWDNNDSDNPHIAAVGYIIIEITETEPTTEIKSTSVTLDDEYEIVCGSDDVTISTTWSDMEVQLYSLIPLSKPNFELYYSPAYDSNGDIQQYDANYTALATSDYIGTVTLTTTDTESTKTDVLQWAIANDEAYEAFVTNGQSELVTYVKFESSNSAYPDIYVELTWAPSNAPISGLTATIANSSKIAADWHDDNSRDSGYLDIHFEVGNPTDPSATDDYDPLVVNETFISGYTPYETIYTTVDNYSSTLAASLSTDVYTFEVDQDVDEYDTTQGNTYYTYVASATSIGVTTVKNDPSDYVELATLDQTTGTVSLVESDILKEILNSPEYGITESYNMYEESLTFTIGLVATTCDPAGSDFITASFESGEDIDVIVVKPLYITEAKVEGMQWNDYSSLTQDLVITLHDYNGYDDTTFFTKSTGLSTIVDFYGITDLEVVYDDITDNYDGTVNSYYGDKYDIEADISISTDSSTGAVTFGTVTLTQLTSSRSNAFEIYLPVKLTYDWGTIYATVTVYVSAASGD